jgi:hypothetical protein
VDAYKRDIVNDRWIPTDEGPSASTLSMEVYSGQHRLWAIFRVRQGHAHLRHPDTLLDEAKFFIESRSDSLALGRLQMVVDPKLGNRTSGFCKAMMRGLSPRVQVHQRRYRRIRLQERDSVLRSGRHNTAPLVGPKCRPQSPRACLWYGPEKIEPFAKRLREIKFPDDGGPAKAAVRLRSSTPSRTAATWHWWRTRRPFRRLTP